MANAGGSTFGINGAVFGLVDDEGVLIADATKGLSETGLVYIDDPGEGVMTAHITNLEAAGTEQYANNQTKRIAHGLQRPQVALTMLDLPFDVMNKMLGYGTDATGGSVLNASNKPNVAMLLVSQDFKGNFYYDAFANGEMIMPSRNHGTNNANETDANATFTYQALAPIPDGVFLDESGNQQPYKVWNSGAKGFSSAAMLKEVFGGYAGEDILAKKTKVATAGTTTVTTGATTAMTPKS